MNKNEKLIKLLQPIEYVSKLKLFCSDCKFNVEKVSCLNKNTYLSRILITEKNGNKRN